MRSKKVIFDTSINCTFFLLSSLVWQKLEELSTLHFRRPSWESRVSIERRADNLFDIFSWNTSFRPSQIFQKCSSEMHTCTTCMQHSRRQTRVQCCLGENWRSNLMSHKYGSKCRWGKTDYFSEKKESLLNDYFYYLVIYVKIMGWKNYMP